MIMIPGKYESRTSLSDNRTVVFPVPFDKLRIPELIKKILRIPFFTVTKILRKCKDSYLLPTHLTWIRSFNPYRLHSFSIPSINFLSMSLTVCSFRSNTIFQYLHIYIGHSYYYLKEVFTIYITISTNLKNSKCLLIRPWRISKN